MPKARGNQSKNLFSPLTCKMAVDLVLKGKTGHKSKYEWAKQNKDYYIERLLKEQDSFLDLNLQNHSIYDNCAHKERLITTCPLMTQFKLKCALIVTQADFLKGMDKHSYASIPERGKEELAQYLRNIIKKDKKGTKYYCKIDIHHCYESVDHDILKRKLRKIIKDKRILALYYKVIDAFKTGLPLGLNTSQWFNNYYFQEFDHYVREKVKVKHYARYMDDMVFFSNNKRQLTKQMEEIKSYLLLEMKMTLKYRPQVHKLEDKPLDMVGKTFFPSGRAGLKKANRLRIKQMARKLVKFRYPIKKCKSVVSYWSQIIKANCNRFKKEVLNIFDFQYTKRRISWYATN